MASPSVSQAGLISPGDVDADVAGHASRKIHDLILDAIAARLQVIEPELVNFLRYSRQRLLPARVLLVDHAAIVGAKRIGKSVNLNFRQSVPYGTLDGGRSKLDLLILGQPRGLAQPLDQR